jgi:hypothetical protein
MSRWYRRDGTPIRDLLTWAKLFENTVYRRVADTVLEDGTRISTVWLGLDHRFIATEGPPLIFETMVFSPETKKIEFAGREHEFHEDWDQECYSTEAEAIAGHDAMVRKWRAIREKWKNASATHFDEQLRDGKTNLN